MELEFVDGGGIGFNFQHQNAYDSLIQIHTVEYVRIVICKLDFQHLGDEIICHRRIIGELRIDGRNQVTILCLQGVPFEATLHLLTFKSLAA